MKRKSTKSTKAEPAAATPYPKLEGIARCEKITVGDFFRRGCDSLQLKLIAGGDGFGREIKELALNRPGLALAGYMNFFASSRLQIIGAHEHAYLTHLAKAERLRKIRKLARTGLPAVIVCRDLPVDDDVRAIADEFGIPCIATPIETNYFINSATMLMEELAQNNEQVHGTMVEVFGQGVLITGKPGVGKSETALGLLKRGHALVSDDTTLLRRNASGGITATAVEPISEFMEIRGLGIIHVPSIFGVVSVRKDMPLDLVMRLVDIKELGANSDRTGETTNYRDVLGITIPEMMLPLAPGRDMVNIIETAVYEHRLRQGGLHAAQVLDSRIIGRNSAIGAGREVRARARKSRG